MASRCEKGRLMGVKNSVFDDGKDSKVWYELALCDSAGWWRTPRRYASLEEVRKDKAGFGGDGRIVKVTETEVE